MNNSENRSLLAFDDIDGPFGHFPQLLGGSASFFSAAAAYFTNAVSIVGVVGDDFPSEHIEYFQSRNIDTSGIEHADGKTFLWKGKYSDDLSHRETLDTQLGVFADFQPKLNASHRDCELLFLGNIHPSLQISVLEQANKPVVVAADTMNFWMDCALDELKVMLSKVQTLIINDEEARQLSGEYSMVIKRGDAGAMLFYEGGNFFAPALPLEEPRDPTGAGDSFAGGFMGYLASFSGVIDHEAIRTAMIYGSVMASFLVEQFSLDGLRGLDEKMIRERFDLFRELSRFNHDEA